MSFVSEVSHDELSISITTTSSFSVNEQQVRTERKQRAMMEEQANARVLKHFIGEVRKSYWNSWGRTYLNDKTGTKVVRDSSNVLGCVPEDWSLFYSWLSSRRAVNTAVSDSLSVLENYYTSYVCDLVPLKGSKEQLLRAVRKESDLVVKDAVVMFMKLMEKRK